MYVTLSATKYWYSGPKSAQKFLTNLSLNPVLHEKHGSTNNLGWCQWQVWNFVRKTAVNLQIQH